MKQYRFLLYLTFSLFAVAFVASSCGDDEPTVESANDLIGVWRLSTVTSTNCTDPTDNGVENEGCTATDCIKWEFREGGVIVATDIFDGDSDTLTGTYSVSGNNLTVTLDGDTATGTFSVSSTQFVYNFEDPEFGCNVEGRFTRDN